ncbi:MAG: LacI family DNA-binding transcriptional regulator [Lachnospiraceae bacterium]|nr:LacI family DNA-binding transcriptional regulator [Lachnospiraceae bacterium]
MAKTVKMQDIAQRLGVSTMTISKALSGKPGVSDGMREKIKALAEEMGYIAPGADKEELKKSYNIGVLLAEYYTEKDATFYWKLYQVISTRAVHRNCFVMIEILATKDERDLVVPKLVVGEKIDGLVVLGSMDSNYLKMLEERVQVPIVYVDFYDDKVKEDSVISNGFYGTYQITNYLFSKGHKDIAFVGTLLTTKSITDRFLGYQKALMEHGKVTSDKWIIPDRDQERTCYDRIVLPKEMPTAFVCNCDLTACKLIKSLKEEGYRVPEDVSVVGYDDFLLTGLCDIDITSYGVDMENMAEATVDVLLRKMQGVHRSKGLYVVEGYLAEKKSVQELAR